MAVNILLNCSDKDFNMIFPSGCPEMDNPLFFVCFRTVLQLIHRGGSAGSPGWFMCSTQVVHFLGFILMDGSA